MRRGIAGRPGPLAAVAALLAAMLLAACGGGGSSKTGSTAGKVSGTLSFWYAPTQSSVGTWWSAFIKRFEARHPGAHINVTQYSTEEFSTKMLASFASNQEPDLFETDTGEYLHKYVRTGKIANLRGLVDTRYYNPTSLGPVTGEGDALYGVPDYWFVLSMWQNKQLMAQQGVTPPRTWSELLAACRKLSAAGVTPIAFGDGGQDQWTAGHWYSAFLYQYGGPTIALDATYGKDGASWSDPPFVHAASRLKDLVDAKCFAPGFAGLNYAQMSSMFLQGRAAMTYTGAWFAGQVESGGGHFGVGVFPLPDGPGAVNSTATLHGVVGGVSALAASARAAKEHGALVAAFLNDFGAAADDYANKNAQLSVAATPHPTGGPLQSGMTKMLTSSEQIAPVTDVYVPANVVSHYYDNLQALTVGDLDPQQFAAKMAADVERERPNLPKLDSTGG